jgi:phosphoglycerate dehydrogenase-like enzyme
MKFGMLLSKDVIAGFGDAIAAAVKAAGAQPDFVCLPDDPQARLGPDDLARIHAAYFTRDLRFTAYVHAFDHAMTATPNLRWIHYISSGMNPTDWLDDLLRRGVRMSTSTGSNAEPVAQIALMGLLLMGRRAHVWIRGQQNRQWLPHRNDDVPPDLAGQTVVVVGLGAVGTRFASYARMLGLKVIGVRRSPLQPGDPVDRLVSPRELPDVLPLADFLVMTCPLTAATRGLIDARALSLLKPTASFINVARGEVVDEAALIDALRRKALAGAYLDVYAQEPLPVDSPLWDMPTVVMSPHNASSAQGNEARGTGIFIENIGRLLRDEPLRNEYRPGDD